jgi:membrane protease YdiL (CAAX protease family)
MFGYGFIPTSWLFYLLIIGFVIGFRRQSFESIGFGQKNSVKSIKLGLAVSLIFVVITISSAMVQSPLTFKPLGFIGYGVFYYLLEIGLLEELMFRGFIQTRLLPFFKRRFTAIAIVGVLFMVMHIPFQMGIRNMGLIEFIQYDYVHLLLTFVYHFMFTFLYLKYKHIAAPTIVHFFMNFTSSIIV